MSPAHLARVEAAARRQVVRGALARLGGWQEPWRVAKEAGYGSPATGRALADLRARGYVARRVGTRREQGRPVVEYRLLDARR